jgi:hypothetical protein
MTHYLCFTGMKKIDYNDCPPPPYKTIYSPPEIYIDKNYIEWEYLRTMYQGWPMYRVKNVS